MPNQKWLTDITEMAIPAGKIYVSVIVDCYDGLIVAREAGSRPDAALANLTFDKAIKTLKGERPVLHSDRGCQYRWPGWLERISGNSASTFHAKKGCSPDNAACEGFWGRMKNECFYGRSFADYSIEQFIAYRYQYIDWYNNKRVKLSLLGQSPMKFRQLDGSMVRAIS